MKYLVAPEPPDVTLCFLPETPQADYAPTRIGPAVEYDRDHVFNVLTVKRINNYIYQTLSSLHLSGFNKDLNLYVGQGGTDYLENISHHQRVKINPPTTQEMYPAKNLFHNWLESIKTLEKPHIIIEDDVIFQDDWQKTLTVALDELYGLGYDNFILTLASQPSRKSKTSLIAKGSKLMYTGTYALYYSQKAIELIYPCVAGYYEFYDKRFLLDVMIKQTMWRKHVNFFSFVRPIARHIGLKCSLNPETITPCSEAFSTSPCD